MRMCVQGRGRWVLASLVLLLVSPEIGAEIQKLDRFPLQLAQSGSIEREIDDTFWNSVKGSGDPAELNEYLKKFPNGRHAKEARRRLKSMQPDDAAIEARLGLSKTQRREVQKALKILGHNPRGIDGGFGANTRKAIRAYQRSRGDTATGYLTRTQWQALLSATAKKREALAQAAREAAAQKKQEQARQREEAAQKLQAAREAAAQKKQEQARQREEAARQRKEQVQEKNRSSSFKPEMVHIKGGCFQMGSPEWETGRDDDERQHRVCVGDFEMGKYEVTVGEFQKFVQATGYRTDAERDAGEKEGCFAYDQSDNQQWDWRSWASWRKPNKYQENKNQYPVSCVSWNDAIAYIEWLSGETGQPYRLPTEAEWEYAARAGTTMARYWGNNPDQACRYANVADQTKLPNGTYWTGRHACMDRYWAVAPVGHFRANAWGLEDTLGNVWEWTCSRYDENYGGDEKGCFSNNRVSSDRVLRGGAWFNLPARVRSANRYWVAPVYRYNFTGFRLSKSL